MIARNSIRVEQYQFIDNLEHIIDPQELGTCYTNKIEEVKKAFLENGWEGDGKIGLIWIPPFLEGTNDTMGRYVWHVKQDNNGISFLGYEEAEYSFNELEDDIKHCKKMTATITFDCTKGCLESIQKYRCNLDDLAKIKHNTDLQEELYYITLNAIQNNIVASFIDYIDELYLRLLKHVFDSQNSDRLKLSKANIKLPLDDISIGDDAYIDSWLLIQQIESAIWKDFKFRPFKDKFKEICNAVDFKCNDELRNKIICHVEIRNSFQHHNGQLVDEIAKKIGQEYIDLLDENGKMIKIQKWKLIVLSIPEIQSFCDSLDNFIKDYEQHISNRMKDRWLHYIKT